MGITKRASGGYFKGEEIKFKHCFKRFPPEDSFSAYAKEVQKTNGEICISAKAQGIEFCFRAGASYNFKKGAKHFWEKHTEEVAFLKAKLLMALKIKFPDDIVLTSN